MVMFFLTRRFYHSDQVGCLREASSFDFRNIAGCYRRKLTSGELTICIPLICVIIICCRSIAFCEQVGTALPYFETFLFLIYLGQFFARP